MTNDPKQKPDLHEEALESISKKVDEKLAQIMSGSFDEEMERKLAEIQELRQREKEALTQQGRDGRRGKRRRHEREEAEQREPIQEKQEAPELQKPIESPVESPIQKPIENPIEDSIEMKIEEHSGGGEKKCGTATIAEIAAQAVEEAAKRKPIEKPAKPGKTEKAPAAAEEIPSETPGQIPLSEEERVARAVDQFFNTAEKIAAEDQLEKRQKRQRPKEGVNKSIDGFVRRTRLFLKKVFRIGKDLQGTKKGMEGQNHLTYEKRMAKYGAVWGRHLSPVTRRMDALQDWMLLRRAQLSEWFFQWKANTALRGQLLWARFKTWMGKVYAKALVGVEYAENHKMKLFGCFTGAILCVGAAGLVVSSMTAYEYAYNGRVLGIVKDQNVVYKTIDVIGGKLAESLNADIEIDKEKDIAFKKVYGLNLEIDSKDDVLNSLTYMRTLKAKGYAIVVDGKQVAVMQSSEAANGLLQTIKEKYAPDKEGVEYEKKDFAQEVKVQEVDTLLGTIQNTDAVMEYMLTGAVEKKVHLVEKGQTFNAIAKSYGLKPSQLQASNPGVAPDKLKIGQQLILTQDSPLVTVQTKEKATYIAEIPFEVIYEETASKYKGEKTVKQKGTNGEKQVEAEIVRNNGVEVSRTELSSTILSQPVSQVVLVGTKEKPKTAASGTFTYPVRGARLSSKYGARWGRTHQGIDLAVSKGTPIVAADGGTVTFSGYKGSYGYLVIINHGNGKETYYAHCSKLLVSRGAKVYKGQTIAKVGSTGNSTGPHCHFEIHVNGVSVNPMKYL